MQIMVVCTRFKGESTVNVLAMIPSSFLLFLFFKTREKNLNLNFILINLTNQLQILASELLDMLLFVMFFVYASKHHKLLDSRNQGFDE